MKLLIVGGSSFIGKNLVMKVPKDWNVTATYCRDEKFVDFCKPYSNVKPVKLDLTDINPVDFGEFDTLVYIAANTDTMGSRKNPLNDLKINALGVFKIVNSVKNLKRFIYFSSGAVYLLDKNHHHTLPYCISKRTGEDYVRFFSEIMGFKHVILRLFETYGRFNAKHKVIRRICEAFERGETTFDVKGDGNNLVDTIYIDDMIEGLLKIITSDNGNVTVDICRKSVSIREMADTIAKVYGINAIFNYSGVTSEVVDWRPDNSKAKELFGFNPQTSLEEGLKKWKAEKIA